MDRVLIGGIAAHCPCCTAPRFCSKVTSWVINCRADHRSARQLDLRLCCKSRFALVVGNSAGRRCDFRVKMWGASSPHVKLTGDLANVSDAIRIGDCFPFRNFAKNQSPCNFRLLQQYPSDHGHEGRRLARQRWPKLSPSDDREVGHRPADWAVISCPTLHWA
jgi:hypothetical protein